MSLHKTQKELLLFLDRNYKVSELQDCTFIYRPYHETKKLRPSDIASQLEYLQKRGFIIVNKNSLHELGLYEVVPQPFPKIEARITHEGVDYVETRYKNPVIKWAKWAVIVSGLSFIVSAMSLAVSAQKPKHGKEYVNTEQNNVDSNHNGEKLP